MTERIRFTVTQENIDAGRDSRDSDEMWSQTCPVARALVVATGADRWAVSSDNAFEVRGETAGPNWKPSTTVARFIKAFDAGKPVAPFTGEVYR